MAVFLHKEYLKTQDMKIQNMRNYLLAIIIGNISSYSFCQQTNNVNYHLTLEECLNYAFNNNYNRQIMKLTEEANESAYKLSKFERMPNLSASLSETFSNSKTNPSLWSGSLGLSTGIVITQGGTINNTIKQNRLKMEQSYYETSQYENDLTIQILQAFLTALGNEELLKLQESILSASEEQLKQGKEQFEAGQILESDYLMLQAQYASDRNNIVDTRINLDNSLLALKVLLSMDPLATLGIIYPDTSAIQSMAILPAQENVLERALNTLPDLKISQYNIDIAKLGIKLSQSAYYPTLNLNASIGTGHSDFNTFGTQLSDKLNEQVGLSLSVPIYNRSKTKSNVIQNKIALQQAELNQQQTDLSIRQTVIQEYQNVVGAYSKYEASTIKQNAYLKTFEAYRMQFNVGSITAVDLLQQQNNYISALNEYIQSKYGFILKRKILDIYMGEKIKM